MDHREFLTDKKTHIVFVTTRSVPPLARREYMHQFCALIRYMDTRVATLTSNKIGHFLAGHRETYSTPRKLGVYASEIALISLMWILGSPWRPVTQCEITQPVTKRSRAPPY